MILEHQISVKGEGAWFAFLQNGNRPRENINISGRKVAVKTQWSGQIRLLLPTDAKACFLVLVYLYKYKHF